MNKFNVLVNGIWILVGVAIVWSAASDIKEEFKK